MKTAVERLLINIKTKEEFKNRFYPIYSLVILIIAELLCYELKLYRTHTIYIIILNGMYFGFMTSKLIVCNMAKKPIEKFAWDNLVFLIAVVLSILANSLKVEIFLISTCALVLMYRYAWFMYSITHQLLKYLNISF